MKIILASGSPRRKELLEQMGLQFEVMPSAAEEDVVQTFPAAMVEKLSYIKACEVAAREPQDEVLYIGADTLVASGEQVLGKPETSRHAVSMLKQLQGGTHQVYTGVTLIWIRNGKRSEVTFSEKTEVTFYPMSEDEIEAYVQTKEPMDKAGAYGIQGRSAIYIKKVDGDYNNVVGLPIGRLYQEMKLHGIWER
ncbi:MAG: Maf family protein [Lachnospiraceae bacterium]|jgi:septum formation protein